MARVRIRKVREDIDEYFLRLAEHAASRSTCARAARGCVLVSELNHVIGTGYNGVPRGIDHCTDNPCPGAEYSGGKRLDLCEAVHAESNALIQCMDAERIHTAYCTASPCWECAKKLLNTSCKRVVFREAYGDARGLDLLDRRGLEWLHLPG